MSGGDFARIAGTVDELAFQTKLLALNAAFEAARSQEQGRSLARLAVEMSRLVDRSTRAVRDIRASFGKRRTKRPIRRPTITTGNVEGGRDSSKRAVSPESASTDAYSGPDRRRGGRPWTASSRKHKRRGAGERRPRGGKDTDDRDE